MDMSFANQALSAEYLVASRESLNPGVYPVPHDLDMQVGSLKLTSMGIAIDSLTEEQSRYLAGWQEGT
jgi:adenosylhomocysteinase